MSRLVGFFKQLPKISAAIALIVAFVPLWASDFLLDIFVAQRENAVAQAKANDYAAQTRRMLESSIKDINALSKNRNLIVCSSQYVRAINDMVVTSPYMRHVAVIDNEGQSQCGLLGKRLTYTPATLPIGVAGFTNDISVVELELGNPLLMVSVGLSPAKRLAAFVPINPMLEMSGDVKPDGIEQVQVFMSGNLKIGDYGGRLRDQGDEILTSNAIAGAFPVKFVVRRALAPLRANYAELDLGLTFLVGAMSALTLLALLHFARQTEPFLSEFEQAIKRGEIVPRYQPVIDLQSGALIGCEVLVRWQRDGKMVPPDMFIAMAERHGLALPMTLRLMEIVRDDLARISQQNPSLKISINLFEGHLRDLAIVDDVRQVFEGSGIGYHQLVFELTERQPVKDVAMAIATIKQLKALGCRVALDDAGTGHSNLASIVELGIDIVKIDRVFVSQVEGTQAVPVLDALIEMAKQMNLSIIAEGIETLEQARYLKQRDVRAAQGYLFARPLPASAYIELASRLVAGQLEGEPQIVETSTSLNASLSRGVA